MDILHGWQIKVVAVQLLCLLGALRVGCFIAQPRPALAQIQPPANGALLKTCGNDFQQN